MLKKCKSIFSVLLIATLCVAICALSGCSKAEKDLVKALNTMKIDSSSPWKTKMNLETVTEKTLGTETATKKQTMDITVYSASGDSTKDNKTDISMFVVETIRHNGEVESLNSFNEFLYLRKSNDTLDTYYGTTANGQFIKESRTIDEIMASSATDGALTPEMRAKVDELAKFLKDNSFMTKSIVDACATSTVKKGVQTITFDLVKYAQKLVDDAKEVVNSLNHETIINDIYAHEKVKALIDGIFVNISADELYNKVMATLSEDEKQIIEALAIPKPTSGQSVYEYIGVILNTTIKGVKFGQTPIGTEVEANKDKILATLDTISKALSEATAKVSVSIKKGEFIGGSCELILKIAQPADTAQTVDNIKLTMNMEKDSEYNFVDVSKLTISANPNII